MADRKPNGKMAVSISEENHSILPLIQIITS
jgi:hypothetical protein